MSSPTRLPLIEYPSWARARSRYPRGWTPPPEDDDSEQWILDMRPYFSSAEDQEFLKELIASEVTVVLFESITFKDRVFDGTYWTDKEFNARGSTTGTEISLTRGENAAENASLLFHEAIHARQSETLSLRAMERDAYEKEEAWRMSKGLEPVDPGFRTQNDDGEWVTNAENIARYVDEHYPGTVVAPDGVEEVILGRTADGQTRIRRADKTYEKDEYDVRDAREGDSYEGPKKTEPRGGATVDLRLLLRP